MVELTPQQIENLRENNLFKIFALTKKNEIVKHTAGLTIFRRELINAIIGCQHVGYRYFRQTHVFMPEHLNLRDKEVDSLGCHDDSDIARKFQKKFFSKVNQGYKERKMLIMHLFVRAPEWHAIYFSENDSDVRDNNHWHHGAHIHFINYLWGVSITSLLDGFPNLPGNGHHIKFDDSWQ